MPETVESPKKKPAKPAPAKEHKEDKGKGKEKPRRAPGPAPPPRLGVRYRDEIVPALQARFGIRNRLAVPRLEKIVVSMGVGEAVQNKTRIEHAQRDLARIAGQRPVVTRAKRSISGFKLRQGMPIGVQVTLRRERMYEFLDRLVSVVIPRIRDFRGLPRRLDGAGNYNLGVAEQTVFPEIRIDEVEFVQGMNVALVTNARTDERGLALLEQLGLPFRQN
jgi:large subunit ribosomal protein L5